MARQSPFMSSAQFSYPSGYQQRDTRYTGNSSVESAMGLNRRPSLLAGYHNHFGSPERTPLASYYPTLPPMSMGPHVDEHSKRSRYVTGGNLSANSQLLPLSIDVKKEQQVYQPQTEAISPSPDDPKNDSNIRDSTIIRNAISKLESDIDITMKKLHRAKLSQSEIRSQADRSAADEEPDDRDDLLRTNGSQTLIEKILHDNRKKAEDSQKLFHHLNNNIDLTIPLYQEANDLESIRRIRTQYITRMKNQLKDLFKRRHQLTTNRRKIQSDKYDRVYQEWQKSIEKDEKTITNKDAGTYREIFEKTFSELRKNREDKEKKQGNANETSTTDPTASVNPNTIDQELEGEEEEKLRKSSVVPPILHDRWQRKHQYFNQNGLIKTDPAEFYKERTQMSYWSAEEKQIFIDKFTQSPKNFGYISSFLENKTTEQCVQFYYMTKKSENYKNLLRKQSQASRRKAKQTTTTTTTMVTSSTTVETTLVTKVTSSNTIVSSTSQQMIESDRANDRLENDEERREINSSDGNEEKRSNKNRCQLLSCTTEKLGKKKNRKNRLRAFPNKWNELSEENRELIRRSLQIPSNVQRCCTRCYEKLIIQVRQRETSNREGEDDDDEESTKISSNLKKDENLKHNDEWTENDIQRFTEALEKFNDDWIQIANYVQRSEQSCRVFYQKYRQKRGLVDDERNIDEDNGSISGSEDADRRGTIPVKSREMDEDNDDDPRKAIINEDSNESAHAMIIDEVDAVIEQKKSLSTSSITINSIVEKEISKTLQQSEKRAMNPNISPSKPLSSTNSTVPPPLVTLVKSRSPPTPSHTSKGSIMRGTPISPSSNKPISIDTSSMYSHHYSNPRGDHSHHTSHHESSKLSDQQLYLQQQAAYMRHYSQNNPPPPPPPSHHRSTSNNPTSQSSANKSLPIDASNNETYETLRADFVTSRYLTTHSPNHERQIRHPSEQRSPSQPSSASQQLLPPPTAIAPPTSNSSHPHHSQQQQQQQQQAVLLAASQMLASSGMYPQELLNSGLLPYPHYYGPLSGGSYYVDPRLMHDFASAANSEQLKHLRSTRHLPHSPPDPSSFSSQSSKRHSHENIEHLRYPNNDYPTPIWRTQNLNNSQQQQQMHSQLKSNENPMLKLNELSRHSNRLTSATDREARSPDEFHHRLNQSRPIVESPSLHFQRVEAHNHHKSSPHEKLNPNLYYSDHPSDGNPSSYSRSGSNVHKTHANHHLSGSTNRSSLIPSTQISPHHSSPYLFHGHHHSPVGTNSPQHHPSHYTQSRSSHHNETLRNLKESISIQEFMKQNVNDFVASTNNDIKHLNIDSSSADHSNNQLSRMHQLGNKPMDNSDQPILIDDNDDSDSMREQTEFHIDGTSKNRSSQDANKSTMESDATERRRDSSIKKILSNQPLEKQEYVEINQKVQNSTVGASKVHSGNDPNGLERANSAGGRETTRSRGSITMRMLMGANGIYADGKAQPLIANETTNEQPIKRAASPDKTQSLEYLIRGELVRACPNLPKNDETAAIFQSRNSSNRLSPVTQQRTSVKRMRASPRDESTSSAEQRPSSHQLTQETFSNVRDPFVLQSQPKTSHSQSTHSSSNNERNWQSYVQQQYQQSLSTRPTRPAMSSSGSITQGSPLSPPTRLATDPQQYPSTANNQLINPRYSHYINKNESQFSPPRRSPTSPIDHSPKGRFARRAQQSLSSSSDTQHEPSLPITSDQPPNLKSPSPISSSVSPTASTHSTSAHPLKKRLISEYELEQQRNSPANQSPTPSLTKTEQTSPDPPPSTVIPEEPTTMDTMKESTEDPSEPTEPSS